MNVTILGGVPLLEDAIRSKSSTHIWKGPAQDFSYIPLVVLLIVLVLGAAVIARFNPREVLTNEPAGTSRST